MITQDTERLRALVHKAAGANKSSLTLFVPGRLELLGKHTDYAGGQSLVSAVERGFLFASRPRQDDRMVIRDVGRGLEAEFEVSPDLSPCPGQWENYARVVARRIARNFARPLKGADIFFAGNLSPAAGMSTSSALITGFFHLLARHNDLFAAPEAARLATDESRAEYLGAIENGSDYGGFPGDAGVGTRGGCQDHAAILLSRAGFLHQIRFLPLTQVGAIPFPAGYVFAVAASGVVAEKTGSAMGDYNRISRITSRILEEWNRATGQQEAALLPALLRSPDAHHRLRAILRNSDAEPATRGSMVARLEQLMMESTVLVPDAATAIAQGDLESLGRIVDLSQTLAERMLGNQLPETVALARLARRLGALAASSFGAGFGGSVYALVSRDSAERFAREWAGSYLAEFPHRQDAEFFLTGPGNGMAFL